MTSGELSECRDANEEHGAEFEDTGTRFEGGCDQQYASQIGSPIPEDDSLCWEMKRFGYTEEGEKTICVLLIVNPIPLTIYPVLLGGSVPTQSPATTSTTSTTVSNICCMCDHYEIISETYICIIMKDLNFNDHWRWWGLYYEHDCEFLDL